MNNIKLCYDDSHFSLLHIDQDHGWDHSIYLGNNSNLKSLFICRKIIQVDHWSEKVIEKIEVLRNLQGG
jgi:hypothetical protein